MDRFATSFDFMYLDLYLEVLFGRPGYSPPVSVSIISVTAITPFDFNRGEFKDCSHSWSSWIVIIGLEELSSNFSI